jgi:hypothetical protein
LCYAQVDILNPPLPWLFGKWNGRDLQLPKAKTLGRSITAIGPKPFRAETQLYVVMERKYIHSSNLESSANTAASAPPLKLSAEGLKSMHKITVAGGRHRYEALKICKADAEEEIGMSKLEIATYMKIEERTDAQENTLQREIRKLDKWTGKLESYGPWGVVVFDGGTSRPHLTLMNKF